LTKKLKKSRKRQPAQRFLQSRARCFLTAI
jgi:hypothetical protein